MRILVIGQTSLHWGRMEFGNMGNYYIIEPFFRELHRVFPNSEIYTTLQMSDEFCINEKIARLPIELYYSWDDDRYLQQAIYELGIAEVYNESKSIIAETPFIKEVIKADLVIDFSGDIWGGNADLVGKNRFIVGLLKNKIVQLLGKKNTMLAGSPGPFKSEYLSFAKNIFENFNLVTNREEISSKLLSEKGFDTSKVVDTACPAFLFEPAPHEDMVKFDFYNSVKANKNNKIGFALCGWNLLKGPFNRTDINDVELEVFAEVIEDLLLDESRTVYLVSHSGGFDLMPSFKLKEGRDFPIMKQLYELIFKRGTTKKGQVVLLNNILLPKQMKAVIGLFDFMVSGRVHAAVAALSQNIPTVIIDYGHEPKAHKLKGFAQIVDMQEYIVNPREASKMKETVRNCFSKKDKIKLHLEKKIPIVQEKARSNFELLKHI